MADIPPPPEGRFGKWAYQLWDYVAKNRLGVVNAQISATSPILLSSSGISSFGISHATSGGIAGTYGGTNVFTRFSFNAQGHVTEGTNMGTQAAGGPFSTLASLIAAGVVTGTTTTGTLTTAQNFLIGSSVSVGGVPVACFQNLTPSTFIGSNGTFSFGHGTAPAKALQGAGRAVRFDVWGTCATFIPVLGMRFTVGGVTLMTVGNAGNPVIWGFKGNVVAITGTTQAYNCNFYTDLVNINTTGTLGLAGGSAQPFGVVGVNTQLTGTFVQLALLGDQRN